MTQEATTPPEATTETPAAPTQEVAPEATPAESAPEESESTSTELSLADRLATYEAEDSPDREEYAKVVADHKGRGYSEAVENFRPQMEALDQRSKETSTLYDKTYQGVQTIGGLIRTALDSGTITESQMSNILQSNTAAFEAFTAAKAEKDTGTTETASKEGHDAGIGEGTFQGAQFFIEQGIKAVKRPALTQKYTERLQAVRAGQDDATKVAQDFANDLWQGGYDAGLASKSAENKASSDVEERAEQKPPQGIGSMGSADDNAKLMDTRTPVSELVEIRNRQKAG